MASAEEPEPTCGFMSVGDIAAPREPEGAVRIAEEQAEKAALAEQEAAEAAAQAEAEYERQEAYYEPHGGSYGVQGNPDGLNSFDGTYDFNGAHETWYPSSAGVLAGTENFYLDDQGFYRTSEGYYVVASDDYEYGTVIETSQGQAQVLDSFTDDRSVHDAVDFYVNW